MILHLEEPQVVWIAFSLGILLVGAFVVGCEKAPAILALTFVFVLIYTLLAIKGGFFG